MKIAARLAGRSTFCFPVVRPLIAPDQQRVQLAWSKDVLRLVAYDRCNAKLEILDGFRLDAVASFLGCVIKLSYKLDF